jgi:thiamine biosynthesis lipoprotein
MRALVGVFVAAVLSTGPVTRFEFEHAAMGSQFRIVVHSSDEIGVRAAAREAFARIDDLDRRLSDYDPDSDLRRLEKTASIEASIAHADVMAVLSEAQVLAYATGGAFDVTVGALTRLWRWAARRGVDPPAERIAAARSTVGFSALQLDRAAGTVTIERPGLQLDLGGIAKGYAVDAAFEILESHGYRSILVDGGGDLRVGRAPPGTSGWRITLPSTTTHLENIAVATSGATYRFLETGGGTRSHVLDPRSGFGVTDRRIVTVFASTASRADGLASALSVLGEGGTEVAKALGAVRTIVIERGPESTRSHAKADSNQGGFR